MHTYFLIRTVSDANIWIIVILRLFINRQSTRTLISIFTWNIKCKYTKLKLRNKNLFSKFIILKWEIKIHSLSGLMCLAILWLRKTEEGVGPVLELASVWIPIIEACWRLRLVGRPRLDCTPARLDGTPVKLEGIPPKLPKPAAAAAKPGGMPGTPARLGGRPRGWRLPRPGGRPPGLDWMPRMSGECGEGLGSLKLVNTAWGVEPGVQPNWKEKYKLFIIKLNKS